MRLIYSILFCIPTLIFAQVGIGTISPDESSIIDISSTNHGILFPRLTQSETEAIVDPAEGLIVFCTDCCVLPTIYYHNGDSWGSLSTCDTTSLPPITETDVTLVAGTDPNHLTSNEMPYLFDGDINPPAGINNMRLHTFHPNNPNPNTIELVSMDTFPIGTKIAVYWYNSTTESDHLELSFSLDGGLTYIDSVKSPISALTGVTYVFTVFTSTTFNTIRLRATLPVSSGEMLEPYLNEILVNDGATEVTFQN